MVSTYGMRWTLEALEKAHAVVNLLEEKKGENILLLDIHEISSFTDFFILCNGTSDRMLQALGGAVRDFAKK